MIKTQIAKDMKAHMGGAGFINRKALAGYLGYKDPHAVDKYLHGLKSLGKQYFIEDVAERLAQAAR